MLKDFYIYLLYMTILKVAICNPNENLDTLDCVSFLPGSSLYTINFSSF